MPDPNLRDFYNRVARIQDARTQGYGFEAPGTLGLSYYRKAERKRTSIWGPLFFVIVMSLVLKGAIHYRIGEATYNERVADLMQGGSIDKIGGWLMQADPATLWISSAIRDLAH